jgi:hypothetical protein
LADPFALTGDHAGVILCESYDYRSGKGAIVAVELSEGGVPSAPKAALHLSVHASYPFLFEHDGGTYCVPETSQARKVTLFRADRFPYRWTEVGTMLENVAALDNTVFQHGGRWWLACTDSDVDPDAALLLWHAARPQGPWEPHADNHVKVDAHSSRPGGTPFVHRGNLYRPAQDSSKRYGKRIVINRVRTLTPSAFEEEAVSAIEPYPRSPYTAGVHTISGAGDMTLLDGHRFTFFRTAFSDALHREASRITGAVASLIRRRSPR